MKKVIKYNYIGFWNNFAISDIITDYLFERYEFILSDNPEYLFCSCFTPINQLNKYDRAIRVFFSGENVSPDFIFFDYWIGFDNILFEDRYFQFPEFMFSFINKSFLCDFKTKIENKSKIKKSFFCDFIYSHERPDGLRKEALDAFSSYKRVESAGALYNNQDNNQIVSYQGNQITKYSLQEKCRFSLIIESTDANYFITEKIIHSFYDKTIPIFFGTREISSIFNNKAFINFNDFSSIDDLLQYVKKVDNDANLYESYFRTGIFNNNNYIEEKLNDYNSFLSNIFDSNKIIREKHYSVSRYNSEIHAFNNLLRAYDNIFIRMIIHIYLKITRRKND